MNKRKWQARSKINESRGRFTPDELLTEKWVPITPVHQVSSLGRLRRLEHKAGFAPEPIYLPVHKAINLLSGDYYVIKSMNHLVYENFNGQVPIGLWIIHLDGDKENYRLTNLKAVPRKEVPRKRRSAPLTAHP